MAKVTVYNPTTKSVYTHVWGQLIHVPAQGSTQVSQKKLKALLAENPALQLTQQGGYKTEDFEAVRTKLRKAELVELATLLMKGLPVRIEDVVQGKDAPDAAQEDAGDAPPSAE